jgi:hypothetical protein
VCRVSPRESSDSIDTRIVVVDSFFVLNDYGRPSLDERADCRPISMDGYLV